MKDKPAKMGSFILTGYMVRTRCGIDRGCGWADNPVVSVYCGWRGNVETDRKLTTKIQIPGGQAGFTQQGWKCREHQK